MCAIKLEANTFTVQTFGWEVKQKAKQVCIINIRVKLDKISNWSRISEIFGSEILHDDKRLAYVDQGHHISNKFTFQADQHQPTTRSHS